MIFIRQNRAKLVAGTLGVAVATTLTGCGAADTAARTAVQAVTPWQDTMREYLDEEFADGGMTDSEVGEFCLGISMFGIDTPEQVGAMIFAFDEDGELPPASLTLGEWAEQEGETLPLDLPKDVTVREVADEAGAYLLDLCGVDF